MSLGVGPPFARPNQSSTVWPSSREMDVSKDEEERRASGNAGRRPPKEKRDAGAWKQKVRVGGRKERAKQRRGR